MADGVHVYVNVSLLGSDGIARAYTAMTGVYIGERHIVGDIIEPVEPVFRARRKEEAFSKI